MATMTGLLALAMVGAAPAADPCDEAISVQVRVFDMDGLGWRSEAHARLRPVATRGTSTVWTADRSLLESLAGRAKGISATPRVDAVGEAALSDIKPVHYVARVDRVGDATMPIALKPSVETIDAGVEARVRGRKLEQGMLTQVLLSDTRILAMHPVSVTEHLAPAKPGPGAPSPADRTPVGAFLRAALNVNLPGNSPRGGESLSANIQVPEVAHAEIEGEWLIPNDGILVVSLGVDTVGNHLGHAVPRERLAVIEVGCDQAPAPIAVSRLNQEPTDDTLALMAVDPTLMNATGPGRDEPFPARSYADIVKDIPTIAGVPTPHRIAPRYLTEESKRAQDEAVVAASFDGAPGEPVLPTPAAPARMLPLPVDANGNVVELPPLPIAASTLDDSVRPAANQPSPQSVHLSMADPAIAQATFLAPAPGVTTTTTVVSTAGPSLGFGIQMKDGRGTAVQEVEKDLTTALKTPGKTETIQVPLGGNLALEIKATVVPSKAAEPAIADGSGDSVDRK